MRLRTAWFISRLGGVVLCAVLLGASSGLAAEAVSSAMVRYEAEAGRLLDGAAVFDDSLASGGKAVSLEESGAVEWNVELPAAGRYRFQFRYRARSGEKAAILAVNDRELGLGLPYTTDEWAEVFVTRTFLAGSNRIVLRKDWPGVEVDYLRFDFLGVGRARPAAELPFVTPRRNIRYTNELADIDYKLDRNGHRLQGMSIGGQAVAFNALEIPHLDDAVRVRVAAQALQSIPSGVHSVREIYAVQGSMPIT